MQCGVPPPQHAGMSMHSDALQILYVWDFYGGFIMKAVWIINSTSRSTCLSGEWGMGLKNLSFSSWLDLSGDQSPFKGPPKVTSLKRKMFLSPRKF